jgi:GT2 family glycosyltransferase
MLASLPAGTPAVLVENGPEGAVSGPLPPGVRRITLPRNEGFGRACNRGAAEAKTEFLLFLNPDARLQNGALDALVACARARPEVSAWNPVIREGPERVRSRRNSGLVPATAHRNVLSGAAFFVSRDRFDAVGGFDPAIFLYHEDDDLALRLLKLGPLEICETAETRHQSGRGSARDPETARLKGWHMARSRVHVRTKRGRAGAAIGTLLRATLGLASPLNLSPRKRAKAVGFFKGALSAMRDGGRFDG